MAVQRLVGFFGARGPRRSVGPRTLQPSRRELALYAGVLSAGLLGAWAHPARSDPFEPRWLVVALALGSLVSVHGLERARRGRALLVFAGWLVPWSVGTAAVVEAWWNAESYFSGPWGLNVVLPREACMSAATGMAGLAGMGLALAAVVVVHGELRGLASLLTLGALGCASVSGPLWAASLVKDFASAPPPIPALLPALAVPWFLLALAIGAAFSGWWRSAALLAPIGGLVVASLLGTALQWAVWNRLAVFDRVAPPDTLVVAGGYEASEPWDAELRDGRLSSRVAGVVPSAAVTDPVALEQMLVRLSEAEREQPAHSYVPEWEGEPWAPRRRGPPPVPTEGKGSVSIVLGADADAVQLRALVAAADRIPLESLTLLTRLPDHERLRLWYRLQTPELVEWSLRPLGSVPDPMAGSVVVRGPVAPEPDAASEGRCEPAAPCLRVLQTDGLDIETLFDRWRELETTGGVDALWVDHPPPSTVEFVSEPDDDGC